MKRRGFLLGSAAVAALAGWRFGRARDEDGVAGVIYKRLGYLPLDEAGVRQFASDFTSRHLVSSAKLRTVAALGSLFRRVSLPDDMPLAGSVGFAEERITTLYLLSTDFFTAQDDGKSSGANRPVRYLYYYDAMRGCANPFRTTVTDTDSVHGANTYVKTSA